MMVSALRKLVRMMGASSKARLYLKYLRSIAEKTDVGRLAGPSVIRLVDDAMSLTESQSAINSNTSAKLWDTLEEMLPRGSSAFLEPQKFGCFLVMDPHKPASVDSAVRYWGRTIQSGGLISGAFGISSPQPSEDSTERVKEKISPMPFASIPHLPLSSPDWNSIMMDSASRQVQELLSSSSSHSNMMAPVNFNSAKKSVTLLMPGFDKSEIKLYQYRGGSELLVEAGDQRRVIPLPSDIQGKVAGAKFLDQSLVITM